ncbi:MAG: cupredoxin domain-containing protein, partial [Candidatus Binatia bacterium]|nr:cupredoxin domain-containing protein [Candidatus Binatia bacterium]
MSRSRKTALAAAASALIAAFSLAAYFVFAAPVRLEERDRQADITMYVEQFAFSPSRIAVKKGQRVNLRIISKDVTHGIFIDGYGIKKEVVPGRPTVVSFVADRSGKIQIRCSVICGPLHPFMLGEIVVQPNTPFLASSIVLLLLGAAVIGFVETGYKASTGNPHPQTLRAGLDLFRFSWIKRIFDWRSFQFALIIPGLAASILVILTGFWGTPIGAKNFSMISVWVLWWGVLVVFLLPFAARAWCAACPVPAAGEWFSRGAFVERASRSFSLGFSWPRQLRNRWLINIGLTLILLLGLIITTRPWVTALLILSLILAAATFHFFFERRAFCRYICPIGGFLGLYSMVSPLELRSKDETVCRRCRHKACYRGSTLASERDGGKAAYPCPLSEFTGVMER